MDLRETHLPVYHIIKDFPGGSDSKASAYKVGDPHSIPGSVARS